jgi:phosphoribosylglycinamide formyltransferase
VVLAGFLHILSQEFLEVFSGVRKFDEGRHVKTEIPIINLHPALPGAFDGAGAIERAFEAFKKGEIQGTGVMVHHVVRDVDRGEPILTRNVEILESDDLAALEERIHAVEHEILVEAAEIVLQQSSPI